MILIPELAEDIQAPGVSLPDQAENGREIVGENDETKPATVDQSGGLEDFLFLLNDDFSSVWCVFGDGVWVLPCSAFINLEEFLSNILDAMKSESKRTSWEQGGTYVVIAVEQNQENADSGRK